MDRSTRPPPHWLLAEPGAAPALQRCLTTVQARLAAAVHAVGAARAAERSLVAARATFLAGVADIAGPRSAELQRRIGAAAVVRDLWHLRADVFALVSHALDQTTAQDRLAQLNRHFPTRSPRSGFASLDAKPRA